MKSKSIKYKFKYRKHNLEQYWNVFINNKVVLTNIILETKNITLQRFKKEITMPYFWNILSYSFSLSIKLCKFVLKNKLKISI